MPEDEILWQDHSAIGGLALVRAQEIGERVAELNQPEGRLPSRMFLRKWQDFEPWFTYYSERGTINMSDYGIVHGSTRYSMMSLIFFWKKLLSTAGLKSVSDLCISLFSLWLFSSMGPLCDICPRLCWHTGQLLGKPQALLRYGEANGRTLKNQWIWLSESHILSPFLPPQSYPFRGFMYRGSLCFLPFSSTLYPFPLGPAKYSVWSSAFPGGYPLPPRGRGGDSRKRVLTAITWSPLIVFCLFLVF